MTGITKIIECVPNFSEGKNPEKIKKITDPFRHTEGVKLLDCQADKDHNRLVVTVIGSPKALSKALITACGVAISEIDMNQHKGAHPRMGAIDVIPFIPVKHLSMEEVILFSTSFAETLSNTYGLPVFLYEKSATQADRSNLSVIRKGEFENMPDKLKKEAWHPDYGPAAIHPTAGVTAVGARMALIAYNVNLNTENMAIADDIAKKIRHIGGGLRYVKAIAIHLKDRKMVQVSMNLTDFTRSALYQAMEMIRYEAKRYGVTVSGSEIVGLLPMQALTDTVSYYLGLENFSVEQVLESRLIE